MTKKEKQKLEATFKRLKKAAENVRAYARMPWGVPQELNAALKAMEKAINE